MRYQSYESLHPLFWIWHLSRKGESLGGSPNLFLYNVYEEGRGNILGEAVDACPAKDTAHLISYIGAQISCSNFCFVGSHCCSPSLSCVIKKPRMTSLESFPDPSPSIADESQERFYRLVGSLQVGTIVLHHIGRSLFWRQSPFVQCCQCFFSPHHKAGLDCLTLWISQALV